MKITEVVAQSKIDFVTIYIDMDGVVANFEKHAEKLLGNPVDQVSTSKLFKAIRLHTQDGGQFWNELEKMSDADVLMDYLKKFKNREMLSSTGDEYDVVSPQKMDWMQRHYPEIETINLVKSSKLKSEFAHSAAILIDDKSKSIDPFVAAGGIGILHTSAANTIKQLQSMGL